MSYPILYQSDERSFETMGLGALSDVISCTVSEERNGPFELEMSYPVGGDKYDLLAVDRIILAPPNDTDQWQPFRITSIAQSMNEVARIVAEHVSYQLNHIGVTPFSANRASYAIKAIAVNSVGENPFTFSTDIASTTPYRRDTPTTARLCLSGEDGSLVQVYGGELRFDRFNVQLLERRGIDRDAVVEYGKNLTSLDHEISIQSLFDSIYPYYYGPDTTQEGDPPDVLVQLPERVLEIGTPHSYRRTKVLDLTAEFDGTPTAAELWTRARDYLVANGVTLPDVTMEVSFVPLWQTSEYKHLAPLEQVRLCDTLTVRHPQLGVDVRAKVVKTSYDVVTDRYAAIDLGTATRRLDNTISDIVVAMRDIRSIALHASVAVKKLK